MIEKKEEQQPPDRPLECSECKKTIAVRYTEITGHVSTHTSMCAECPELQKRLYGINPAENVANQTGTVAGLACGNCGTTLLEVRCGHLLGCSDCYTVFEDVLLVEIQAADALPPRILPTKKNQPVHIGRAPGENFAINLSSRLLALNEALTETLNREDYEQAALLRDQIKALTENAIQKNDAVEGDNHEST